jgi:hypothetical protein
MQARNGVAQASPYRLVLANGAFKSGSTWLRDIVQYMREFHPIPHRYARSRLPHWIRETMIEPFLEDPGIDGVYLSKSHIYLPEVVRRVSSHGNVRILNIRRDLRDVVVSAYYHYRRKTGRQWTFSDYYWKVGRLKAYEVIEYQNAWQSASGHVLFTEYEALKSDFANEVVRIAAFLDLPVTLERAGEIRELTDISRSRQRRGEENLREEDRFFRKGIVGDWENHFAPDELRDVERIESHGLKGVDYAKFYLAFPMRRRATRWLGQLNDSRVFRVVT